MGDFGEGPSHYPALDDLQEDLIEAVPEELNFEADVDNKGPVLPCYNLVSHGLIGVGFEAGESYPPCQRPERLVEQIPANVAVGVAVMNASKFSFDPFNVHIKSGVLQSDPMPISPGLSEVFLTHKKQYKFSGSSGSVTWRIGDQQLFLCVTWSVPRARCCYSNWLMVGITDTIKTGPTIWKEMYHGSQDDEEESWFRRKEFSSDARALRFTSRFGYHVTGLIGSGMKALATVTIVPKYERDCDQGILAFIKEEN